MFQKNVRLAILGLIGFGCGGWASTAFAQRAVEHYVEQEHIQGCPNCGHELPRLDIYGWRGTPHHDETSGGCRCGKKTGLSYYNAYHHWTSPASFLLDHGRKGCAWRKGSDTTAPRFRDALDRLAKVRLLPPVRKDSGSCGPQCDPYGLVGVSRRGVTVPSQPQTPVAPQPESIIGHPVTSPPVASRPIVPQPIVEPAADRSADAITWDSSVR